MGERKIKFVTDSNGVKRHCLDSSTNAIDTSNDSDLSLNNLS